MWMTKRKAKALEDVLLNYSDVMLDSNRALRREIWALKQDLDLLMDHHKLYIDRVSAHSVVRTKDGPEQGVR